MSTPLNRGRREALLEKLEKANAEFLSSNPGDSGARQPVHTVYGGAQLFRSSTATRFGELALAAMAEYAPTSVEFANGLGLADPPTITDKMYEKVQRKLREEPVEDFRIDFEDGYGIRPAGEEDQHAEAVAGEVAKGLSQGTLPPSIGIRIKSFGQPTMARSVRTLELFVTALARAGGHGLTRLIVTLPKVSGPTQVEVLNDLLGALEHELGLPNHWLKIEVMIETPQALVAPSGEIQIRKLLAAAAGRCLGVHLGPYDYTASLNITASEQSLMHPACDFVRNVISVALSGAGVALADGPENMMPIGPHRAAAEQLTMQQRQQNWHAVHRAWSLSCRNIQHALSSGIFQGWDLHPAQLPARYGAVYSFFLRSLDSDALRLKTLIDKAAQARLLESVFDDAATGQGLLNSFRRAVQCGAISGQEAQQMTGLRSEELASRSFEKIVSARPSRSSPSS